MVLADLTEASPDELDTGIMDHVPEVGERFNRMPGVLAGGP
jgi:hypothetical protein